MNISAYSEDKYNQLTAFCSSVTFYYNKQALEYHQVPDQEITNSQNQIIWNQK